MRERTWPAPGACLVAPRGSGWVGVEAFAPRVVNPSGVLLLHGGERLEGWDGDGDVVRFDPLALSAAARLAGLPCERPFLQPWVALRTEEFMRLRVLLRRGASAGEFATWLQPILRAAPAAWRKRPQPAASAFELRGRFDLAQAMVGYLDEHGGRNVALAELAQVFGLSSFHLLRVFRRETGLTPHQYALQLRLRRTLLALEARREPLRELAAAAGFSSHAHFSTAFRAAWGLTPAEYAGQGRLPPAGARPL